MRDLLRSRAVAARVVLALMLCAAWMVASAAPASTQSSLNAEIVALTEGDFPQVSAVVNLSDTSGGAIDGLTATDFTATVGGHPAPVTSAELASSENLPFDILLVIDTSGSTEGEGLAQAKSAAKSFIRGLAPTDRVGVARYANSWTVVQEFTTDHPAAAVAIDGLVSRGQTETYKATAEAVAYASTSTATRRAVIFLSDGAADAIVTGVTSGDALARARAAGIPFFTIAQGGAIEDTSFLNELASATRGRFLEAPQPSDLTAVYANIGRLLRSQYIVTFDATAAIGLTDAPIAITVSSSGRSATATSSFAPSAAFAAPKVTINGLTEGESFTEVRELTLTVEGGQPVTKAAYYVDDINVFETSTPPYAFRYDPAEYEGGEHALRASVQFGEVFTEIPAITFTSTPPAAPASTSGGGGGTPFLMIAVAVGVAIAVVVLAVLFVRGRLRRHADIKAPDPEQRVVPWAGSARRITQPPPDMIVDDSQPAEDIGEALGMLISRAGSDLGSEYAVGGKPVSIGSGSRCAVHINDPSLGAEEARIWIRKGVLMLHKLTRLSVIATDGVSGGWQMLEPGDTFNIGEHTFEFQLLPETAPSDADTPAAETVEKPSRSRTRPTPLRPGSEAPTAEQPNPVRLTEMMPQNNMGVDSSSREEQAS